MESCRHLSVQKAFAEHQTCARLCKWHWKQKDEERFSSSNMHCAEERSRCRLEATVTNGSTWYVYTSLWEGGSALSYPSPHPILTPNLANEKKKTTKWNSFRSLYMTKQNLNPGLLTLNRINYFPVLICLKWWTIFYPDNSLWDEFESPKRHYHLPLYLVNVTLGNLCNFSELTFLA